jgi:hypothetical protein
MSEERPSLQPGLDATNWRTELAIRFGVILRKVWEAAEPG